jgi:DNA-binding NtrC family response regulator
MVLVIDDELFIRDAVADILDFSGIKAICASDGQEGLALFRQHHDEIRVVLLDMKMPGMDGLETLRHLRTLNAEIKVILCSGVDETVTKAALTRDRALLFLQKPYTLDALLNSVQTALP